MDKNLPPTITPTSERPTVTFERSQPCRHAARQDDLGKHLTACRAEGLRQLNLVRIDALEAVVYHKPESVSWLPPECAKLLI